MTCSPTGRPADAAARRRRPPAAGPAGRSRDTPRTAPRHRPASGPATRPLKIAMPLPVSAARPARSTNSSTRSISVSPESARPRTVGTSMPGCHRGPAARAPARAFACPAGRRVRLREPLEDPEQVGRLAFRRAQFADRRMKRGPPAVGAGIGRGGISSLPVPNPRAHRRGPQRVEQHRLADAPQPGKYDRALRPPPSNPFEEDVEGLQLGVAAGQLRWALAGAGGIGVSDRSTIGL